MTHILPPPPLSVPTHDDETFLSLVSRRAARNGAADLFAFRRDIGVRQADILDADHEALAALALGAGIPDHPSLDRTPRADGRGKFILGQAHLSPSDLARFRIRICPECIRRDHRRDRAYGRYQRVRWLLADVHACAEHALLLVDITDAAGDEDTLDFHRVIKSANPVIQGLPGTKVSRIHHGLETYLSGRIAGSETCEFLDEWTYRAVAGTAQALGCLVRFGAETTLSTLCPQKMRMAGHSGFRILQAGPEAIQGAFESIRRQRSLCVGQHRERFGAFFAWLRNKDDAAFDQIKAIVRAYILRTFPIPKGTEVLGVKAGKQRQYTLPTGASTIGMDRSRLGHRLVEMGLATVEPGQVTPVLRDYIPLRVLEKIKADEANDYDLPQVAKMLGIHRNIVGRLARCGLLGKRCFAGAGTYRFRQDDLWKLKQQLFGCASRRSLQPPRYLPLFEAARRYRLPVETLIQLTIDGKTELLHRVTAHHVLDNLFVPVADLDRLVRPARSERRTHAEATHLLRTDRKTITELVTAGLLREQEIHLPHTQRAIAYITTESVRLFRDDYVSLTELASVRDREPGPYAQHLAKRGIFACEDIASNASIYRRKQFDRP